MSERLDERKTIKREFNNYLDDLAILISDYGELSEEGIKKLVKRSIQFEDFVMGKR